jgi:hypothetical protein
LFLETFGVRKMKKYIIGLIIFWFGIINLIAEEEYEDINWKYLNFDLGYGSSGPGGAFGFRYWYLGTAIGVTGFANDIPLVAQYEQGVNIQELPKKFYPSNVVCADLYGYYDFDTYYEVTAFVNVGFFAAIDSVMAYQDKSGTTAYYPAGVRSTDGMTFGAGVQAPLTFLNEENRYLDQLVAGVGYHSKLGAFLRIAYRWE